MIFSIDLTLGVLVFFLSLFVDSRITSLNDAAVTPHLNEWPSPNRLLFSRQNSASCAPYQDPDTPLCRSLCGSSSSCTGGTLSKRYSRFLLDPILDESNKTGPSLEEHKKFYKRQLAPVLQDDVGNYLIAQLQNNADPYFGPPLSLTSTAITDANVVQQRQLGRRAFQVGTGGLCGCTIVTVVSTQAVYMGHFFEDYSFASGDAAFKQRVLNFFTGGGQDGIGPAMDPYYFSKDDDTRVYVMTPRKSQERYDKKKRMTYIVFGDAFSTNYNSKIPKLLNTIRSVLWSDVPIALRNYEPLDCNAPGASGPDPEPNPALFESERANALFQFDPDAFGNGKSGWRLFYEGIQFSSTDPAPGPEAATGVPDF